MLLNRNKVDNFNRWLAALRSGSYTQGTNSLVKLIDNNDFELRNQSITFSEHEKDQCAYCCLGIACVLSIAEIDDIQIKKICGATDFVVSHNFGKTSTFLPPEVGKYLGIPYDMWARSGAAGAIKPFERDFLDIILYIPANNTLWGLFTYKHPNQDPIIFKGVECFLTTTSGANDDGNLSFSQIADLLEFTYL